MLECPPTGWQYVDRRQVVQGPFTACLMRQWYDDEAICPSLEVRCHLSDNFRTIAELFPYPLIPFVSYPQGRAQSVAPPETINRFCPALWGSILDQLQEFSTPKQEGALDLSDADLVPVLQGVSNDDFVPPNAFFRVMNKCTDCIWTSLDGENAELCDLEGIVILLKSPDLELVLKYLDEIEATFNTAASFNNEHQLVPMPQRMRARKAMKSWISEWATLRQHCSDFWQICEDAMEEKKMMACTSKSQENLEQCFKSDFGNMLKELRASVDSAEVKQKQQMALLAEIESAQSFVLELSQHAQRMMDTANTEFERTSKEWEIHNEIIQTCRRKMAENYVALTCVLPIIISSACQLAETAEFIMMSIKIIFPLLRSLQGRVSELQVIHDLVRELKVLTRRELQAHDALDEIELDLRKQRRRRDVAVDDPAEIQFTKKKTEISELEKKKQSAEEQLAQLQAMLPCRISVDDVRNDLHGASEAEISPAKRAERKLAELERVHESFAEEVSIQHQERETLLTLVEQGRADAALRSHLSAEVICPILLEVMVDPVLASDGHTYERCAIERWLDSHNTSPMTGAPLVHTNVYANLAVKKFIASYSENSSQSAAEP